MFYYLKWYYIIHVTTFMTLSIYCLYCIFLFVDLYLMISYSNIISFYIILEYVPYIIYVLTMSHYLLYVIILFDYMLINTILIIIDIQPHPHPAWLPFHRMRQASAVQSSKHLDSSPGVPSCSYWTGRLLAIKHTGHCEVWLFQTSRTWKRHACHSRQVVP